MPPAFKNSLAKQLTNSCKSKLSSMSASYTLSRLIAIVTKWKQFNKVLSALPQPSHCYTVRQAAPLVFELYALTVTPKVLQACVISFVTIGIERIKSLHLTCSLVMLLQMHSLTKLTYNHQLQLYHFTDRTFFGGGGQCGTNERRVALGFRTGKIILYILQYCIYFTFYLQMPYIFKNNWECS